MDYIPLAATFVGNLSNTVKEQIIWKQWLQTSTTSRSYSGIKTMALQWPTNPLFQRFVVVSCGLTASLCDALFTAISQYSHGLDNDTVWDLSLKYKSR
jgi:hypothetical protein